MAVLYGAKDGNRAGVKTVLCAVSRNDFSERLR